MVTEVGYSGIHMKLRGGMHRIVQIIVKIIILPLYIREKSTSVKFYS